MFGCIQVLFYLKTCTQLKSQKVPLKSQKVPLIIDTVVLLFDQNHQSNYRAKFARKLTGNTSIQNNGEKNQNNRVQLSKL